MRNLVVSFQPEFIPMLRKLPPEQYNIIALQPQFAKLLTDSGINSKALFEVLDERDQALAARCAVENNAKLFGQQFNTAILPDISAKAVQDGIIARYFYQRLPDIFMVTRALEKTGPALLLGHNDVEPILRLLALWGQANHVPFLHIPHAIYLDTADRGPHIGYDIHDVVSASHLAAAGPYQAQWYAERDPKLKIYVTGAMQFDRLAGRKRDRTQAMRLLRLDQYKPTLVYMSSWRQDTNLLGCHDGVEEAYLNMLTAVKDIPDLQLVVKCHPRGNNVQWHREMADKLGVKATVTAEHLDVTLMAADLVLAYGASNVLLEAATLPGIHVMAINGFAGDREVISMDEHTVSIKKAIVYALGKPANDMNAFVAKYLGDLDGLASDRVANLVKHLAG